MGKIVEYDVAVVIFNKVNPTRTCESWELLKAKIVVHEDVLEFK